MNLDITPDLIRELHDYGQRTQRPDTTGLVLTPDGWDTVVWIDRSHYPVALTADDIDGWLGGEDMDDDCADALADQDHYRVADERGDYSDPSATAEVVVVTGAITDGDEQEHDWRGAWWFDSNQAREIITEQAGGLRDGGQADSLWITSTGRYVLRHRSLWDGEHTVWCELAPEQAARRAYKTDEHLVAGGELPPLIEAARAARDLAGILRAPEVRVIHNDAGIVEFYKVDEAAAITTTEAARALTELVRTELLPALRATRADAANALVLSVGSQTEAARQLGISVPTLNALIGGRR